MTVTTPNRWALAALLLGAVSIAFAPILVRLSELAPSATAFYRLGLAAPVLGLWLRLSKDSASPAVGVTAQKQGYRLLLLGSGIFFAADLAVWHWSLYFTSIANATLLANFAPIFVVLGGWLFLGERFSRWFLGAIAVVLCGATLLVSASFSLSPERLIGDGLGLLAAVFYAGYILVVSQLRLFLPTVKIATASATVGAVILLAIALLSGESLWPQTIWGWWVVVSLAVISQVVGQSLIMYALAHLPSAFASVGLLLQPVIAVLLAWWIFKEHLSLTQGLGGMIVLVGIGWARWCDRR